MDCFCVSPVPVPTEADIAAPNKDTCGGDIIPSRGNRSPEPECKGLKFRPCAPSNAMWDPPHPAKFGLP